jgi:hypothetical protein
MAVETLTRCTCDRCKSIIEETPNTDSATERAGDPLLYLEARGLGRKEPLRFDDLCARCKARVEALLAQLDLKGGESDPVEDAPAKKPKKKKGQNSEQDAGDAPGAEPGF